jgi:hypothetical protein
MFALQLSLNRRRAARGNGDVGDEVSDYCVGDGWRIISDDRRSFGERTRRRRRGWNFPTSKSAGGDASGNDASGNDASGSDTSSNNTSRDDDTTTNVNATCGHARSIRSDSGPSRPDN